MVSALVALPLAALGVRLDLHSLILLQIVPKQIVMILLVLVLVLLAI